ncbi:MAG: hypothetical protein AAGF89_08900 [Bacteroidota bacterium]
MMTPASSLTGINAHRFSESRQALTNRELDKALNWQVKDFTLFSTNLRRCLPELPPSKHWNKYINLLTYRSMLLQEHENCEAIDLALAHVEESTAGGYTGPLPAIFTSFHFGSYRSIVGILVHQRVDFVMVINDKLYRAEEQRIRQTVARVQASLGTEVYFDILNAEDPSAAVKMSGYLMRNISLAIFADGNTGIGGEYRKDGKMARLNFLGQPIYVRKGAAVLAKITRKPIVPLFVYYPESDSLAPAVVFHDPIYCRGKDKVALAAAIGELYGILENYVRKYPDQWQTWFYFHKFLDVASIREEVAPPEESPVIVAGKEVLFNTDRYALFRMDANGFLFDRATYKTFPLEPALFDHLVKIKKRDRKTMGVNEFVGIDLGQYLLKMRILIPSTTSSSLYHD